MRQGELATAAGVSLATVKALEQGKVAWSPKHLVRFAAVFEVEPYELITGPLPSTVATSEQQAVLSALETGDPAIALRAVADWIETRPDQRLSPRQRAAVSAIATGDAATLMGIAAEMLREAEGRA